MLKMKKKCQYCGKHLAATDNACICSYECTFCESCAAELKQLCPNCSGELVPRPKRFKKPLEMATKQVKKHLDRFLKGPF